MERTGRSAATAFQPLPSHLHAAAQEPISANGTTTPSYGGLVSTGVEWDFVVNADGTKRCVPVCMFGSGVGGGKEARQER